MPPKDARRLLRPIEIPAPRGRFTGLSRNPRLKTGRECKKRALEIRIQYYEILVNAFEALIISL
jgi:hypothetical protein